MNLIPWPYRWLTLVLLAAALIGFGWVQLALGLSGLLWPFLGCGVLAVRVLVMGSMG